MPYDPSTGQWLPDLNPQAGGNPVLAALTQPDTPNPGRQGGGGFLGIENVPGFVGGAISGLYHLGADAFTDPAKFVTQDVPNVGKGMVQGFGNLGATVTGGLLPTGTPAWERPEGLIPGVLEDVGSAAAIAAPVAGGVGLAAKGAESAAAEAGVAAGGQAAAAGADDAAAAEAARAAAAPHAANAEALRNLQTKINYVAHPYRSVFDKVIRPWSQAAEEMKLAQAGVTPTASNTSIADDVATAGGDTSIHPQQAEPFTQGPTPTAPEQAAQEQQAQRDAAAAERAARPPTEPPVPEGYIRAYRATNPVDEAGTAIPDEQSGKWWATGAEAKKAASAYGKDMQYVDLTPEEAAATKSHPMWSIEPDGTNKQLGNAHVLPDDIAERAKPLTPQEPAAGVPHAGPEPGAGTPGAGNAQEATQGPQTANVPPVPPAGVPGRLRQGRLGQYIFGRVTPGEGDLPLHTRLLAGLEERMQGREALQAVRQEQLKAEVARKATLNDPTVRAAVDAAQRFVRPFVDSDLEASRIVGEEVRQRITGVRQLTDSLGISDEKAAAKGVRETIVPKEVRDNPEWNARIEAISQSWHDARVQALETMRGTRLGEQGLENAGKEVPVLTKQEFRDYRIAQQKLTKAGAMDADVIRENLRAEGKVAGLKDELGKTAAQRGNIAGQRAGLVGKFDELNSRLPMVFRGLASQAWMADRLAMVDKLVNGDQFGFHGFTYDPATRTFVSNVEDVNKGRYVVGLVPHLEPIPLSQVTPDLIDAMAKHYQDLFGMSDHVMIGGWTDDQGMVHLEPSEIVDAPRTYAVTLGNSRAQQTIWDLRQHAEINSEVGRPDISGQYVGRSQAANGKMASNHTYFDRYANQAYDAMAKLAAAGKTQLTPEDIDAWLSLEQAWGVHWADTHPGNRPDQFFQNLQVKSYLRGPKEVPVTGELLQTMLNLPQNPEELAQVYQQLKDLGHNVDGAAGWYFRSHNYIETMFRGKKITLLNGHEMDAADLMYQLTAVTSIQAGPPDNFASALTGYANMREWNIDKGKSLAAAERLVKNFRDAPDGAARSTELFVRMVQGTHHMEDKTAQMLVMDILSGHTITPYEGWDGWTTDYLKDKQGAPFGNKPRGITTPEQRGRPGIKEADIDHYVDIRRQYGDTRAPDDPGLRQQAREDAILEYNGSNALAKLRSFHENLADPAHSPLVTLDSWMKRMFNTDKSGFNVTEWRHFADLIRETADRVSVMEGRKVMPHELQAIFWSHVKTEISRQNIGIHWAAAADGLDLLHSGNWRPEADPVLAMREKDLEQARAERSGRAPVTTAQGVPRQMTTLRSQAKDLREVVGPYAEDESAAAYMKRYRLGAPHEIDTNTPVDEEYGRGAAQAYDEMKSEPNNPQVKKAYKAFITENERQWKHMTEVDGIKVDFVDRDANPYHAGDHYDAQAEHAAMLKDLRENKHLYVDKTSPDEAHPVLTPEQNDRFRAVHDYYGHSRIGNDFSRNGEEIAFEKHAQMYSPEALKAMATETRGQNSWLNFSRHSEERRAAGLEPEFPEQKAGILPPEYRATGRNGAGRREETQYYTPSETTADLLQSEEQSVAGMRADLEDVYQMIREGHPDQAEQKYIGIMNQEAKHIRDEEWGDIEESGLNPTPRGQVAEDRINEYDNMPGAEGRTTDEFHQQFQNRILGSAVVSDPSHLLIKLFQGADFTTLVHESAHIMRQMLSEDDVRAIERGYGVARGAKWTRDQEERFANDVTGYLASGKAHAPWAAPIYGRLQMGLLTMWGYLRDRYLQNRMGISIPEGTQDLLDRMLNPHERPLEAIPGMTPPLPVPQPRSLPTEVRRDAQLREGITPTGAFRQGLDSQRFIQKIADLDAKDAALADRADEVTRQIGHIRDSIADHSLPVAAAQRKLQAEGEAGLAAFNRSADNPAVRRVPAEWQPMWQATQRLMTEMGRDPALLRELGDTLPRTFSQLLDRAKELGIDPVQVRNFRPQDVERLVFHSMRLGKPNERLGTEAASGSRRTRMMSKLANDTTIEGLAAATLETVWEARTNAVVDMVETNFARSLEAGNRMPAGWVEWSARKSSILGTAAGDVADRGTLIIPKKVDDVLRNYSKDYSHTVFGKLGKFTNPWKFFVLTLSPKWYVHRLFGNMILTALDGVRLQDWVGAWKAYKRSPDGTRWAGLPGITSGNISTDIGTGATTLGGSAGFRDRFAQAGREKGLAGQVGTIRDSLLKAHDVIDEFARAADYLAARRKGMTAEAAMLHSHTALVDYSNLSNFERQIVAQVFPFYAFEKAMFMKAVKLPIDHPASMLPIMALNYANQEAQRDEYGQVLPPAYQGYIKTRFGSFNTASLNPLQNADMLIRPGGIAGAMNPFLQIAARQGFNAPAPGTGKPMMDQTGHLVNGVDVQKALLGIGTGLPQLQAAGANATTSGVGTTAANFLGVPVLDDNAIQRIVQRQQKTQFALQQPGVAVTTGASVPNPNTGNPQDLWQTPQGRAFAASIRTPDQQAAYDQTVADAKARAQATRKAGGTLGRKPGKRKPGPHLSATPRKPHPSGARAGGVPRFHFTATPKKGGGYSVRARRSGH